MEQRAILLNGGRDLDVTLVPGADEFLAKLLGTAPSKPTVPGLKLVDNAPGQRSVGVFIGSRQIGFLDQTDDPDLIATLRACQINGAAARVRGSLLVSANDPDKVNVTVSLAESDQLLGDPGADRPAAPTTEASNRSAFEPASLASSVSPGGMTDPLESAVPDGSAASELFAGHMGDYPEWPPREPLSAEPIQAESPVAPAPPAADAQPSPDAQPTPDAQPARDDPPTQDVPSAEDVQLADTDPAAPRSNPSPETLLSTRSAWMGATPMPGQTPQPGWLGSSQPAGKGGSTGQGGPARQSEPAGRAETPYSHGAQPAGAGQAGQHEGFPGLTQRFEGGETGWLGTTGQASQGAGSGVATGLGSPGPSGPAGSTSLAKGEAATAMGGDLPESGTATVPTTYAGSWQDYADGVGPSGEGKAGEPPATGWTAGASDAAGASASQPSIEVKPTGMSSNAKAWIAGVLVVAVLAGAGFALWKTFWASKTYTDPEYGYSFSYPGGWDTMDLTSGDIASAALVAAEDLPPMDAVVVGDIGDSVYIPDEFSVAVVGMFDTGIIVDDARIAAAMQETQWELAQMPNLGYGLSFGVVEPPTQTTVGTLNGYTMTLSMDAYGMSTRATYCFLFDGSVMYVLGGMCDADAWSKFQKTFDSLVSSFKPGHTRF